MATVETLGQIHIDSSAVVLYQERIEECSHMARKHHRFIASGPGWVYTAAWQMSDFQLK